MHRGTRIGVVLWVVTFSLDWLSSIYVSPGTLGWFVVFRVVGLVNLLAVTALLGRRTLPSPRVLKVIQFQTYVGTSVIVGLLSVRTGGIESAYASTLAAIMALQGIAQPDRTRAMLPRMALTMIAYVATLGVASMFEPALGAQFHAPRSLAIFGTLLALDVVAGVLLVTGGNAIYTLRREVFEARELGQYRLKRQLGKGGMGEVWLAGHPALKADVAIKIVCGLDAPEVMAARFQREIRALTELRHPNTVRVFDCGVGDGGVLYYVMEYLDGATLGDIVEKNGPLSPARAIYLLRQVARALAEAHYAGIVHRDLKPENVFVTSQGGERDFVKVLDFGIAKLERADEPSAMLTRDGMVMGTPAFMAPEQVEGADVDLRADIYALGAVLYYALVGYIPFEGATSMAVMMAHLSAKPPVPSARSPHAVSPEVDAVVARCMAKKPSERYASMFELDAAFAACERTAAESGMRVAPPRGSAMPEEIASTLVDLSPKMVDEPTLTEPTRLRKPSPA